MATSINPNNISALDEAKKKKNPNQGNLFADPETEVDTTPEEHPEKLVPGTGDIEPSPTPQQTTTAAVADAAPEATATPAQMEKSVENLKKAENPVYAFLERLQKKADASGDEKEIQKFDRILKRYIKLEKDLAPSIAAYERAKGQGDAAQMADAYKMVKGVENAVSKLLGTPIGQIVNRPPSLSPEEQMKQMEANIRAGEEERAANAAQAAAEFSQRQAASREANKAAYQQQQNDPERFKLLQAYYDARDELWNILRDNLETINSLKISLPALSPLPLSEATGDESSPWRPPGALPDRRVDMQRAANELGQKLYDKPDRATIDRNRESAKRLVKFLSGTPTTPRAYENLSYVAKQIANLQSDSNPQIATIAAKLNAAIAPAYQKMSQAFSRIVEYTAPALVSRIKSMPGLKGMLPGQVSTQAATNAIYNYLDAYDPADGTPLLNFLSWKAKDERRTGARQNQQLVTGGEPQTYLDAEGNLTKYGESKIKQKWPNVGQFTDDEPDVDIMRKKSLITDPMARLGFMLQVARVGRMQPSSFKVFQDVLRQAIEENQKESASKFLPIIKKVYGQETLTPEEKNFMKNFYDSILDFVERVDAGEKPTNPLALSKAEKMQQKRDADAAYKRNAASQERTAAADVARRTIASAGDEDREFLIQDLDFLRDPLNAPQYKEVARKLGGGTIPFLQKLAAIMSDAIKAGGAIPKKSAAIRAAGGTDEQFKRVLKIVDPLFQQNTGVSLNGLFDLPSLKKGEQPAAPAPEATPPVAP
jgi:hypothetical protein